MDEAKVRRLEILTAPRVAFVVTVDREGRQRLWQVTYEGWTLLDDAFTQPDASEE